MSPKVLVIDGYNFIHRARGGFALGDNPIVFNFFRNLRALIEQHCPTRVYFCLEGRPAARYELLSEYKANRKIVGDPGDPRVAKQIAERLEISRQKDVIVRLLTEHFPMSVMHHPEYECDDVIYNLIRRSTSAVPWTVISNDSDFIQLLNEFENVKLYNPMTKSFVEDPGHDYVTWKALRGDSSDNIPRLISDSEATRLVNDVDALKSFFSDETNAKLFSRNYRLIKLPEWTDDDAMKMTCSQPTRDWDAVKDEFNAMKFASITKEGAWTKFTSTFDTLWRGNDKK
jgi:5'-3' exonuclease